MALETPNRMVASAIFLIDPMADEGSKQTLRSSNGILRKVSEVDTTVDPGDGSLATWDLETPVSNDEGIVLATLIGFSGGFSGIIMIGWISPLLYQFGDPIIDDVPPNKLVTLAATTNNLKARMSLVVFGLPTSATPIEGEPLPVPP